MKQMVCKIPNTASSFVNQANYGVEGVVDKGTNMLPSPVRSPVRKGVRYGRGIKKSVRGVAAAINPCQ